MRTAASAAQIVRKRFIVLLQRLPQGPVSTPRTENLPAPLFTVHIPGRGRGSKLGLTGFPSSGSSAGLLSELRENSPAASWRRASGAESEGAPGRMVVRVRPLRLRIVSIRETVPHTGRARSSRDRAAARRCDGRDHDPGLRDHAAPRRGRSGSVRRNARGSTPVWSGPTTRGPLCEGKHLQLDPRGT